MQPTFDLRIRSMVKALTESVLPSLDPDNKAAIEQLNIVIGSLAVLKDQVDYVHWFEFVETSEMASLAAHIAGMLGGQSDDLAKRAAEAAKRANEPASPLSERQSGNVDLREALVRLIEAGLASDTATAEAVRAAVMDHSERQIGRERAFIAGTKLEVFADNFVPIRESLQNSSPARH